MPAVYYYIAKRSRTTGAPALAGTGIFASTDVPRGRLIAKETPFFEANQNLPATSTGSVDNGYNGLSVADKVKYNTLLNASSAGTTIGRWNTKAWKIGANEWAIFSNLSAPNHSCLPNTQINWRGNTTPQVATLHATQPMDAHTEILVDYLGDRHWPGEAERRNVLSGVWGIANCACRACSRTRHAIDLDARRAELSRLDSRLMLRTTQQWNAGNPCPHDKDKAHIVEEHII